MGIAVLEGIGDTLTIGETGSLRFVVTGCPTRAEAKDALEAAAPSSIDGVWRATCTVTELGDAETTGLWQGDVAYSNQAGGGGEDRAPEIRFEFGGREIWMPYGRGHVGDWAPPGLDAPNLDGLINVKENEVQGITVGDLSWSWSERHWKSVGGMTPAYKRILLLAANSVNSDAFRGFYAGEVKCGAISGGQTDSGYADLQFQFEVSPNQAAPIVITRGPLESITIDHDRQGWDLLHFRYEPYHAAGIATFPVIATAHIDRIFRRTQFALLGIGS